MENSILTPEEIKTLGLSQEEVDTLDYASYLCDTADILPEEPEKVFELMDKKLPEDYTKGVEKMFEMAEKDPKTLEQLLALYEVANSVKEVEPTVEKLSVSQVKKDSDEEFLNSIVEKLKNAKVEG